MRSIVQSDRWEELRQYTSARIALGRVGDSLPTEELLRFGLAHAQARDAVHSAFDAAVLERTLHQSRWNTLRVHSRAPDRASYLLRPDLGRRLNEASAALLSERTDQSPPDVLFVAADGLSALAVHRHVEPLLHSIRMLLPEKWSIGPVVITEQARVAIGDEIGQLLKAKVVVVLIGERPGLSSPDSLGMYLTYSPRLGCTDAQRNCISNVRPEGLSYDAAANRLIWLLRECFRLQLTGVQLKDRSDLLQDLQLIHKTPDKQ
jgi:ethanolamine ammonia-lyase small subunit